MNSLVASIYDCLMCIMHRTYIQVNIAHFHPISGNGLLYGTKTGKVRKYQRTQQLPTNNNAQVKIDPYGNRYYFGSIDQEGGNDGNDDDDDDELMDDDDDDDDMNAYHDCVMEST